MKIYMTDIRPFESGKFFSRMLPYITKERKEKIVHFKKNEDQCRSLAAGLLLEYALQEYGWSLLPGKLQHTGLTWEKNGKPLLDKKTGIFFNLSHSGNYVAGVFSDCEVGIDVEQIRTGQMRVAERFFTPEEYRTLQDKEEQDKDRYFTELWTRKESYIKAVGAGLALDLASFCILRDRVEKLKTKEKEDWYLDSCDPVSGYVMSVCAKAKVPAKGDSMSECAKAKVPAKGDRMSEWAKAKVPTGGDSMSECAKAKVPAGGDSMSECVKAKVPAGGDSMSVCTRDSTEYEIHWITKEMLVQKFI